MEPTKMKLSGGIGVSDRGSRIAAVASRARRSYCRGRDASAILTDQSGQTLVVVALCMTCLLGAMALVTDVGFVRYQQRKLQTAADSAALAAGLELGNCSDTVCANMTTAAETALKEDGITNATITPTTNQCTLSSSTSLAMTINVAPCTLGTSDPNKGNFHMVEVVLTEPQKMFFGTILGFQSMNLVARAEAGDAYINTASSGGNCLWTNYLDMNSSATLNFKNCGIYSNGNIAPNSSDNVTAADLLYYGTWQNPSNCGNSGSQCVWNLGSSETQPTHTTTQQTDPLANLTPPSQPATQDANNCSLSNQDCWGHNLTAAQQAGTSPVSLPPGYYGGGININSALTLNLSPGLYYFNGSVNVDSGSTLECTTCTGGAGVTLYFANGSLQPNGASTLQLTAPSTGSTSNGSVANMLVWEANSNSSGMTIDATSSSYFNGIIYLPTQTLTLNSGSNVVVNGNATATAVDVNELLVDSNQNFVINGSGGLLGGSSTQTLGQFGLAE